MKKLLLLLLCVPLLFSCGKKKDNEKEKSKINFSKIIGEWEGTYTGDERGTFKGHISINGSISGITSLGYNIDGTVNADGDIKMSFGEVSSGTIFEGYYKNNRFIGTWNNDHYNLSGTFIAEKNKRKKVNKQINNLEEKIWRSVEGSGVDEIKQTKTNETKVIVDTTLTEEDYFDKDLLYKHENNIPIGH